MKPVLDKYMLGQATVDSGSLATMSSIIHRIAEPGEYRGTVYRGTAKVGCFSLQVCDCEDQPLTTEGLPCQVTIDLLSLDAATCPKPDKDSCLFPLRTGGHVVFFVSTGPGEYAVEIYRRERKKEPVKVFDSRLLDRGDLFVTHILRPGRYAIRNTRGKGQADLNVEYPEPGKLTQMMEPVLIECKDGIMKPAELKIQPVQAIMFSCTQPARITIELKKAEDRPRPARPPIVTPAAMPRKEKSGPTGPKTILRKIRFSG
ncbi:MAG: hypothetical protein WCB46_02385 [Methanoregula sp.]